MMPISMAHLLKHLLIIIYELIVFYQCKHVRNDALQYEGQLISNGCFFKSMHRIINFYADALMQIGESYHP